MPRTVLCFTCNRPTISASWHDSVWYCLWCWREKFGNDAPFAAPPGPTFFRPEILLAHSKTISDGRLPVRTPSKEDWRVRRVLRTKIVIEEVSEGL